MNKKTVGNLLILASLIILFTIYLPIIKLFLPINHVAAFNGGLSNSIFIPKINAFAPIIKNVDPWNEVEYRKSLKQGVAQAKGYPQFYFAHSSDSPWNMTTYNIAFLRLSEVSAGDEILIKDDGVEKKYKVTQKKVVWPSGVKEVTGIQGDQIILQTCTPLGTSLKRLLVFASPE